MLQVLKQKIHNNKLLFGNIVGAFVIRGMGMVLSVLALPLYMSYFPDNVILGVWFTVITILNWTLSFDLGIGNGLRNNLTKVLAKKDYKYAKELISSAYTLLGLLTVCISLLFVWLSPVVNWNNVLNISVSIFPQGKLVHCINVIVVGIFISFFLRLVNSILFALQYSTANNFISFITQVLLVSFLFIVKPSDDMIVNFTKLSYYYAIAINIALVTATLLVFTRTELKQCKPSFRHYNSGCAKNVVSLGGKFLIAQVLYMIISATNEWFISKFYGPEYCVEYQIYYKIFFVIITLYHLALTPLWSAITKAYTERKFTWLIKLRNILYLSTLLLIVVQIAFMPFIQFILDVWLGDKSIPVDYLYASIFVLFSVANIWVANISVFNSGLGELNLPIVCNAFAVLVKVLGVVYLSSYFDSWIFVIVATLIGLVPYCVIIPILNTRIINRLRTQI